MWPVLQTFRPRDAIDIVLVAIVLYRVFVMFKETRAVQMLLGLGGLMVASFLARYFELFSTSWLLDNFWSFWVLALIVLFQPELRRALTRLGESRLFQGMSLGAREERSHLIDEVIKAADALASKRIGALIVLERSHRPAQLRRARRAARRGRLRRSAREPLPALLAAARRRRLHPRRPRGRGGLLPAALAQHAARPEHGHAASRRASGWPRRPTRWC